MKGELTKSRLRPAPALQTWFRGLGSVTVLVAVFLFVFATTLAGQVGPRIVLTPNSGIAGSVFRIDGAGFTAQNPIEVRWGTLTGPVIATGSSDSTGSFEIQASVPSDAQSIQYRVFACRTETGPVQCIQFAAATFTVTPPPTTTAGPTTTSPTTTTPEQTTTSSVVVTAVIPTLPPGHGAGTDDYTWWQNTTSTFPNYPYAGPTAPPPPLDESGIPADIDYPDIRITGIEITQGMQNLENAMPLVRGRRTYARVYVDIPDDSPNITYTGETTMWPGVSGAIGVWAGNQFLGTRWPEKTYINAQQGGGERALLDDSLYFRIPQSWTNHSRLRFTAMVWASHPNTIDEEPRSDNNTKTVFVDFNTIADVTVHPVPLHMHRSYHPSDEIRVYHGLFGGPGVYATNSGGNLGAVDVVEGIYRYHPVKSVAIEPWNSVLYPIGHANGQEWNLGPCQTTLVDVIQPGNSGYRNFLWVSDASFFFDEDEEPDIADFTKPVRLVPDRTSVRVMDKTFTIDDIAWDPERGAYELRGDMPFQGSHPVVGAPVFVSGCKPGDYGQTSSYSAPLTELGINRVWYDWDDTTEFFIGMVDPSLPTYFGGLANAGLESTWLKFNDNFSGGSPWFHDGASLAGHEVGHLAYRKHVACADDDGDGQPNELKGGAIDLTHPMTDWFPDCRLAEVDPEGWFGFDVYFALWGLPSPTAISNDPAIDLPNRAYPVMSYLTPTWTDPYHWCRMLSYYGVGCEPNLVGIDWNPPPPEPTDGAYGTPTGPIPFEPDDDVFTVALVTGTVDLDTRQANLIAIDLLHDDFELPPGFEDEVLTDQTLAIEVFDANDELLYRAPLQTEVPHELTHVVQVSAEIILKNGSYYKVSMGDEAVGVFEPSSTPPTGRWIIQNAETDLVFLQWAMEDADEDEILAMVQYSNNGDQWMTLAQGYGLTEFESDDVVSGLPGGDGRFRLLLNDGWNTTVLEGPRLQVENKPPAGVILLPVAGFSFATNEEITFEASVFDVDDRGIDPENLVWSSSLNGEFGRGPSFDYGGLTPGDHEITLEAKDSAGVVSVMVIPLHVDPDVVRPLPDEDLVATVTALLQAVDDGTTTTTSIVEAGPDSTTPGPTPALWWILAGVVAVGAAVVIGSLWNARGKPPAE